MVCKFSVKVVVLAISYSAFSIVVLQTLVETTTALFILSALVVCSFEICLMSESYLALAYSSEEEALAEIINFSIFHEGTEVALS